MNFNKQIAVMLVLASLLLSAIGAAYYFYDMHQQVLRDSSKKVKVYIAKDNIKKNHKILEEDLSEHFITKQEVLSKPLLKKEIVDKYATVDIFKNEMFIKEKISPKPVGKDVDKIHADYVYNSYNMGFKLFANPNYTLQKGDVIKIISTYKLTMDKLPKYSVQYVAKNIKVVGFIRDGKPEAEVFTTRKVRRKVNKKMVEVIEEVKADELVLDIPSQTLLNLIEDWNKGKQLWMVKAKMEKPKEKKKLAQAKAKKSTVKRSYPIRWYEPRKDTSTKSASIQYSDLPKEGAKVSHAKVTVEFKKECSDKSKLLIGVANYVHLRSGPSLKNRIVRRVYRNYIIPYQKKTGNWYVTCDGKYVHQNEAYEISYENVQKKINAAKQKK
jgi:hypothetical protein